jgi:MFS transporter, DHA2 family, multidrug resistance protein
VSDPAMSATITAPRPAAAPSGMAALAHALPSEISPSRLVGIVGVMLGAGIVTLAGRMLTLGLADLKGSLGVSFDQGAWIPTAFNAPIMFIAPFVVYFGAFLGVRKILLASTTIFTLASLLLPFAHDYPTLLVLLVIAGLSSGTFYPLALTFALRNIPLRFLPYTVALYATCIEGAVNFGPPLYGWYQLHASWQWMFWTSAVITPVMIACIYYGVPPSPPPAHSGKTPSFVAFLYFSLGLALFYVALDQGQRLDWWRSGLFVAMFSAGICFLIFSAIRHFRMPNPLVNLPYLRKWNTVFLSLGLMVFRFVLLGTIIVVPGSLAIRGLEASQYDAAVLWTAIPQLFLAFIAGYLLLQGLDPRLLMGLGFALIAFACILNAEFTSAWAPENYYRTELLMAVGQSFAFMGLVSSLILQAIFSGALAKPQLVLTFSCFIHIVRLFGGQIGVATMGHVIADRERVHSNLLGLHVQLGDSVTDGNLRGLTAAFGSKSTGIAEATGRAVGVISGRVRLQAFTLSYIDAFHLVAWACVGGLLLVSILRKAPLNYEGLSLLQAKSSSSQGEHS